MRKTDSQNEHRNLWLNGQTAHIHVCFCQCPFPPENLKTNSWLSHPPDAEHIKRMKARRAGWSLEKDAQNSGFCGVFWSSASLTSIKLANVWREFCVVTLRDLSELMKLNWTVDVALYIQKWANESWQLPEISALKKCPDEKCKLKGDLKMLFRTQADPTLMGERRRTERGRLLQRMTKRISLMKWAEGRRVNGRMKDCSDYTQCCRRALDESKKKSLLYAHKRCSNLNWLGSLILTRSCDCHQNITQCKTAEFSQPRLKGLKYYLNIFLTIWKYISKTLLCDVLQI